MSKTTLTVGELIELARFEFRRFGFRADGFPTGRHGFFEFAEEPATGQAAFSQRSVVPYLKLYLKDKSEATATLDTVIDWIEDTEFVVLGVQYEHTSSGGNGFNVRYRIQHTSIGEFTLKLDC